MDTFLLKNAKLFDGERFLKGEVLVENGIVTALGDCVVARSSVPELDVSGCIVTSGLVDIHVHLSETGNLAFGFPGDLETVPFGVTYAVDACAERSEYARLENLSAQTAVFIPLKLKDGVLDEKEMDGLLELYKDKAIGVKVYFDDSLKNGVTKEHLRSACAYARKKGLKVMVHCSYSPTPMAEIVEVLACGDILTHIYHGGYHTLEENGYEAYRLAKKKGVVLDAGMAGGVHTDFAVLKRAIEGGYLPDTISSDITKFSAYKRGGIYSLLMCMTIAQLLGMDEKEIFKAVTVNAAKAVGKEKEWFGLGVGRSATLAVIRYGTFKTDISDKAGNRVLGESGYLCKMTVKDGKILYRN